MNEKWKQVKGYEPYEVSNLGRVRRNRRVLSPVKRKNGYLFVHLSLGGKRKQKYVHRLVAEAFIPNPLNLPQVNHLDEDKCNNSASNLEWCSPKYNTNYGTCISRRARAQSKSVLQLDEEGNVLKEWPSARVAAKSLGTSKNNISAVCHGRTKHARGFRWRFKD